METLATQANEALGLRVQHHSPDNGNSIYNPAITSFFDGILLRLDYLIRRLVNLASSCTPVYDIQCSPLDWLGEAFSYLWDMDVRSTVSAPKVFSGGRGQSEVVG